MKVAVIGTGYVGLVTGACLANTGNTVVCADVDESKVKMLNQGILPIFEEGLEPLVQRNTAEERLRFTTDSAEAIREAEVIFIAVGTPSDIDGSADLSFVLDVAKTIGEHIDEYRVIVCKSTVPVGTCDRVRETIQARTDVEFDVVSNPEFLKEGSAVKDFQSPARVVIGAPNERSAELVADLYRPFMRRSERFVFMDVRSAEMTKYASNAMLATKISFMNEISNLCEKVGADVEKVREGMSLDERIGPYFIFPGVGYGGSCFPKDIRALSKLGAENEVPTELISAVNNVNVRQKKHLVRRALEVFDGDIQGRTFGVWGLSFKPKTDDVREAPALQAIEELAAAGSRVLATDPIAIDNAKRELEHLGDSVRFFMHDYEALEGVDALFIFTEWNQYRNPDFERMKQTMKTPIIFDGRNLYRPNRMENLGFEYYSIGRP